MLLTGSLSISEVCSNPPDETSGEFVELYNGSADTINVSGFSITDGDALDQISAWSGSFPHSGVVLESTLVPPGGFAVLLEQGYLNDPWLEFAPGTVILTTGDYALCNGLAASSDPLTLFLPGGTGPENVASTFGTPVDAENWEDRDDDGLDSIPFDPGEGSTLFRYPLEAPDGEGFWFQGSPTPGAPPDQPPDTFVISIDSLYISETDPMPGSGVTFGAVVSCWGTVSPDSGEVILYLDCNGDSAAQAGEILLSVPAQELQPGSADTVQVFFTAPEQGWYPAACIAPGVQGRLHFSTGGGVNPVITEVMANPLNEDTEEFIEVLYTGPGAFPLAGCSFTDGDAVDQILPFQSGDYLLQNAPGVIIDPEYQGSLAIPPGTPLFIPGNTTLGNGLTADDPVLLYGHGGTSLEHLLSTAGTPILNDDPLLCDDDGLDGIPFDPGNGHSIQRIIPEGPDTDFNWQASPPGGTPGTVEDNPGWADLATDTVYIAAGSITGCFSNCGVFQAQGDVTFFCDLNGNLDPDAGEVLHQEAVSLSPGESQAVQIPSALPDSGIFIAAATVSCAEDTIECNNTRWAQFLPENPAWPVITEVLCNPSNEDCDEFVEVFFPGPGQADLTRFTISDGDSEDDILAISSPFLTPGTYAVILDPEYEVGGQPYSLPPGTPVFHPGNTTIGDGLSGTDPVILLHDSTAVSQYGTPEDPGDGIPYDPGTDLSVERLSPALPDLQSSWYSSPWGPTPGGPPENITQGVDYAAVPISFEPPMGPDGTNTSITAGMVSQGTDSVSQGQLTVTITAGDETLGTFTPVPPGLQDTVLVSLQWQSQGDNTTVTASISCSQDQNGSNDTATANWNPPPTVCINELFYSEPEWVELYNGTGQAVEISTLTLADPSTEAQLPQGIIEPGGYAVLTEDLNDFAAMWGQLQCPVLEPESWPTLNNGGDSLLLASQGTALDLVPYLSSWGGGPGESLERRSGEAQGYLQSNWGTCIQGGTPGTGNSIGETQSTRFLTLTPTIFNPPDTPLTVEIGLPMQACNVTVKVYDTRGMELETLFHGIYPGEHLVLTWQGNGYPVGRYIVYAEANCSGQALSDAGVVVLARPLE